MSDPEPKPPQGVVKVVVEILIVAGVIFAAGMMWATSRPEPPRGGSFSGLADLGSSAITLPSGLRYVEKAVGSGPSPQKGQTVVVHYDGRFTDGTIFDSSRQRGKVFKFKLGAGEVIKGWEEGVASMKVGGVRRLVVPPDLGYGDRGVGMIPPRSTLVFDIELLAIE